MVKIIALFNHKGGVSKTTTTFHLGWKLAENGKRVIVADFDPQCNLTGMVLGYDNNLQISDMYKNNSKHSMNIKDGLAPAFESKPTPLEPINCVQVKQNSKLFLLPGSIELEDYDATLGIAQELSGSIHALQNIPGAIIHVLKLSADKINADYILIDTSPSLNPLNRNLLMTCDYFLLPTSPDLYSLMALKSLAKTLPQWHTWAKNASKLPILKNATYPFPEPHPKFLGFIVQNYRKRHGSQPTAQFRKWVERIQNCVCDELVPSLDKSKLTLNLSKYNLDPKYQLASISDFNSLIAASQDSQKPVFFLSSNDLQRTGVVLQNMKSNIDEFNRIFSNFADLIIKMTNND